MGAAQPNEQVRNRLVATLAEDRPDSQRLMAHLREVRRLEGAAVCAAVVHLLTHLRFEEAEAEKLLEDVLNHRRELSRALGRDPGLRVAVIDFLSNIRPLLSQPTIVEHSLLERTERSAITDDLTGLHNRRFFQNALEIELRRSDRYQLQLSLLLLDLDSFKSVNDMYGHPFGDLVLQRSGRIVRRAVRESDLACRIGGEEFAVILPETERLGAYAVGERIRRRVEMEFVNEPIGARAVAMTVSGGISLFPGDGQDSAGLIKHADRALYQAKGLGRNRIVLYPGERRGAVRYPVQPRTRVHLTDGVGEFWETVRAIDLSRDGTLLEISEGRLPRDPVDLELRLGATSPAGGGCTARGRVVRVIEGTGQHPSRVAIAFDQPLSQRCLLEHVARSRRPRPAAAEGSH